MFWDWRLEKKWSVVGFCSGAVAGLVAITPASGYVGPPAAVLYGFMAGTLCNFATQLKFLFNYDDALDVSILVLSLVLPLGIYLFVVTDLRIARGRRYCWQPSHRVLRPIIYRRSRRDCHPRWLHRPPLQTTRPPSSRLILRSGILIRCHHNHSLGHALHSWATTPSNRRSRDVGH